MADGRHRLLATAACVGAAACFVRAAEAKVVGFEILSSGPAYGGESFGEIGAYERIDAIARFAIDPASERGRAIVDLDRAPTNEDGEVEFQAEVTILRPVETERGSSVLVYEVPNRGRSLALPLFNLSASPGAQFTVEDPGDGFLMEQGHTLVWSGWQAGLGDELIDLELPILPGLVGTSREEFIFETDERVSTATLTYPAADLDPAAASLTVRRNAADPREAVEGLSFRYIDETTVEITRPEGFDAGAIYELIHPARDAVPAGLAFLAVSDLVSFLRGGAGHDAENPLEDIEHTIGVGISQSGRFLRDLIHQGFNADEAGARVFDGAMPHIAGSRKSFTNARFAQPGRYSRQHEDHDYPGDQFPFTYAESTDPISGRTDGILSECMADGTCPSVMHTDTSTEFWQGRASLLTTSATGESLEMPQGVWLYFLAGAPHFNAWGGEPTETATCRYRSNPISVAPTMRALVTAMEAWLKEGTEPPASVYPSGADGGLVEPAGLDLPRIEGEEPEPVPNPLALMDHGQSPPVAGEAYPVLVPSVDEDGIAEGGIREALIAAPLGSFFGWNLRAEGFAPDELCSLTGSFVPFPEEGGEADSRRTLAARYNGVDGYVAAVEDAAEALVERGFMLPGDVELVVEEARELHASTVP